MTNLQSNAADPDGDPRVESILRYAGALFEFAHEGFEAAGVNKIHAAATMLSIAVSSGLSADDYERIVIRGAHYRAQTEAMSREVLGR